jgi:hypothetical protein
MGGKSQQTIANKPLFDDGPLPPLEPTFWEKAGIVGVPIVLLRDLFIYLNDTNPRLALKVAVGLICTAFIVVWKLARLIL